MTTASDGVRLHVRSVGSGAPLVFVHEFSGDARSWNAQIGFFSRYFRCTA
jgi:pimeloyl-ACP methyl ester carboxylesterase